MAYRSTQLQHCEDAALTMLGNGKSINAELWVNRCILRDFGVLMVLLSVEQRTIDHAETQQDAS